MTRCNPWTPKQDARLQELRLQGWDWRRISPEVGHTPDACQNRGSKLGISLRRKGRQAINFGPASNRKPPTTLRGAGFEPTTRLAFARAKAVTTRPCMKCRGSFRSEGPHNRLCPHCRNISVSPFEP